MFEEVATGPVRYCAFVTVLKQRGHATNVEQCPHGNLLLLLAFSLSVRKVDAGNSGSPIPHFRSIWF
jgi:flavoprotein